MSTLLFSSDELDPEVFHGSRSRRDRNLPRRDHASCGPGPQREVTDVNRRSITAATVSVNPERDASSGFHINQTRTCDGRSADCPAAVLPFFLVMFANSTEPVSLWEDGGRRSGTTGNLVATGTDRARRTGRVRHSTTEACEHSVIAEQSDSERGV